MEKTILRTLFSLEKQSLKEFEIVLVNDGSKDNSDQIIRDYISDSTLDINYITQPNSGVSAARNVALLNTRGDYVVFVDADDIVHKDFLKHLYNAMAPNNVDTAYCCYSRNLDKIQDHIDEKHHSSVRQDKEILFNCFMHRKGPCSFFTFIYKKEILLRNNIVFNEKLKYGEDLEFAWKYLSHCRSAIFIKFPLYGYYDNPYSAVNSVNWRITDALISVRNVETYLKHMPEQELRNKYVNYMFDRTVWAIMKDFSRSGQVKLFQQMRQEYNVEESMRRMMKNSKKVLIKFSSLVFLINNRLFYSIIRNIYS